MKHLNGLFVVMRIQTCSLTLESRWVVYGPENGYTFPYDRILKVDDANHGGRQVLLRRSLPTDLADIDTYLAVGGRYANTVLEAMAGCQSIALDC